LTDAEIRCPACSALLAVRQDDGTWETRHRNGPRARIRSGTVSCSCSRGGTVEIREPVEEARLRVLHQSRESMVGRAPAPSGAMLRAAKGEK
jgi:hypothetical protein